MIDVVSFSGGRTSAYLVHLMKQINPEAKYIFMDTGAEHPKTYEFVRNVVKEFGIELTCLRGDFNQPLGVGHGYKIVSIDEVGPDLQPWREMVLKYGTPSHAAKWCTSRMKQEVHDKYCDDVFGRGRYTTWLGIRADEPRRLGVKGGIKFLADISDVEKSDVIDWWSGQPFDLGIDEWLGNCVFCFKKSDLKLAAAARDEPEALAKWLDMIESAPERDGQSRASRRIIYRGHRSLTDVIATFSEHDADSIKTRIRSTKALDSGGCSESCEIFACQMDLFSN